MPENVDLGTLTAQVHIGLGQVKTARAELSRELGQMSSALDRMATEAEKAGKRADDALKRGLDAAKVRKLNQELKAASDAQKQLLGDLANGMTRTGTVLSGVLIGATAAASKFDGAMRNVNSIAKQSESQFRATSKAVLGLVDNKNIVDGPSKLAEGLYDVYSSGKSGAEAMEVLKISAIGAGAGLTDTATASKVLLATLNSGIKGATDAKTAMDILFKEVDLGVNTFADLAGSIGFVLPQAKLMGVSLQEVAAALATMTRQGLSAAEASTALNNLLAHIAKPGKDAAKTMDQLGIAYGASALEAKGLVGWLEEANAKTQGNKDALIRLVPELRGMRGELILASDNAKLYKDMLGQMGSASEGIGATMKASNEQMKGAAQQAAKAKQELERMAVEIGEHLLPVARDIMREVHGLTKAFHDLDPATQGSIVKFAAMSAGILTLAGGILSLTLKLGELKKLLSEAGSIDASKGLLGGLGARFAGTALGGAILSTAPITAPLLAAGAAGYVIAQDSIATSENKGQDLSLANKDRITWLQNKIGEKGRIRDQFKPGSPIYLQHQADIDRYRTELETLRKTEVSIAKTHPAAAKPKASGTGSGGPTEGQIKAAAEAAAKAAEDRQRAAEIEAQETVRQAEEAFRAGLENWDGSENGRGELIRLADAVKNTKVALADVQFRGNKGESPRAAAATRTSAVNAANSDKQGLYKQIRDKGYEAHKDRMQDLAGASQERIGRELANAEASFDQLKRDYDGSDPQLRAKLDSASQVIRQLQNRLAKDKLGNGKTSETAKEEYQTALDRAVIDEDKRQQELTDLEERGAKKREEIRKAAANQLEDDLQLERDVWQRNLEAQQEYAEEYNKALLKLLERSAEAWKRQREDIRQYVEMPTRDMKDRLAEGFGSSIAEFRSFESFVSGWGRRLQNIFQSLASEVLTNWARIQLMGGAAAGAKGADGGDVFSGLSTLGGLIKRKKGSSGSSSDATLATNPWPAQSVRPDAPAGPSGLDTALGLASIIPGVGGFAQGALALKSIFKFADGGMMLPNRPAIVAEAGTGGELVMPRTPSMAIPLNLLSNIAVNAVAASGGRGMTQQNQINIHVARMDSTTDIARVASDLAWHLEQKAPTVVNQ